MRPLSRTLILTLYAIYILDLMGLVFVYVVIPPLLLDPHASMVSSTLSLSSRNILIGLLVATYPFAQFFAAPTLGDLSDRLGRRSILLLSTLGTALMFILSGLSIVLGSVTLLFISRFLAGIFAGNLTVTQATVGEAIEEKVRGQYMAAFSLVGGFSWTVGPFIAALLSDRTLCPFFDFATPFYFLGIAFLVSAILLIPMPKNTNVKPGTKLDLHKVAKNLLIPFNVSKVATPLVISIITMFGWMMYQGYLAPYLIEKFQFSERLEGYAYAVSSFAWLLGGLAATGWVLKHFNALKSATLPLILSGLSVFCYLFAYHSTAIWIIVVGANFTQSIATGCFFGMFALLVPGNHQGKVFGAWNAGFALASALGPILSGWLVNIHLFLPFLIASLILLISSLYYWRWQTKNT
ncbi:MAG: MFS transporter [Simkaniaceae bacterium]